MTALKLPGGTLLFYVTEFLFPAWNKTIFSAPLIDKQKVDLSFYVSRNRSPALFITMDGL